MPKLKGTMNGADLDLLPKEFALLEFFMRNPGKVFDADAIMRRVWETDSDSSSGAFRTTLMRLRKKLELPAGEAPLIETVHGAGYRFNA
ncbi:MAG: winged helix-turn-helix domain-containing protein [Candidatus Obscuribacterales bacterium]